MLELRFIRENLSLVKKKTELRGITDSGIEQFEVIDKKRRELLFEIENFRNRRKIVSQEIAVLKKQKQDADALITEMRDVGARIKKLEKKLSASNENLNEIVMRIPNLCDESIPVGLDETENREVKTWGEIPDFGFKPKAHFEIGAELGILDLERAAKMSGARFVLLKGLGSRLERALRNGAQIT